MGAVIRRVRWLRLLALLLALAGVAVAVWNVVVDGPVRPVAVLIGAAGWVALLDDAITARRERHANEDAA